MITKEMVQWIKENAYKFEPHETAQSDGEMLVLSEAQVKHLEDISDQSEG